MGQVSQGTVVELSQRLTLASRAAAHLEHLQAGEPLPPEVLIVDQQLWLMRSRRYPRRLEYISLPARQPPRWLLVCLGLALLLALGWVSECCHGTALLRYPLHLVSLASAVQLGRFWLLG